MSKIHFMFSMLNINQVIVIKDGSMVGIITKGEFLKKQFNTILSKPDQVYTDACVQNPI
jgi:signal-transduction protein with cAMP-binding, CBS, and nucleotidyltransferase domain